MPKITNNIIIIITFSNILLNLCFLFQLGPNSGLHIIIFDEIDAICKARGSVAGSTAVHDTVVNQLLSKIDGVDQLNNILVIGKTILQNSIARSTLREIVFSRRLCTLLALYA